jgi:hypothetical protein
MKSFREQTYYELLEVQHSATAEEVRAALQRALELCAPDSVALYALVDDGQAEALRSRLQDAGRVLLDPAARAGYDRMLGLLPAELLPDQPLWTEDDDEEGEEEGPGVAGGPYPRTEPASLEQPEEAAPADLSQASLPLETAPARGPGRTPAAAGRAPGLPAPRPRGPSVPPASPAEAAVAAPAATAGTPPQREPPPPPPAPAPDRPRMPDLPPDAEFNGELLRQVREARGLTLQQLAERTRIGRAHLEKVEADRYADLPPPVYLRGILVSLARELKLDAARVSKSYMLLAERAGRPES